MLRTALGHRIATALADPAVIEIMVNPDGCLRFDRLGEGVVDTGHKLDPAAIERIIRLVASYVRVEAHEHNPIVSAELPPHGEGLAGERFEGFAAASFSRSVLCHPKARGKGLSRSATT